MTVEQIVDSTLQVRDIQSSDIKSLVRSIRALAFHYWNGMTSAMGLAERNPADSSRQDTDAEHNGRKVVQERFKIALFYGHHRRCTWHQLEEEGRQK